MAKQRFSFDDTEEYDRNDLNKKSAVKKEEFVFDDSSHQKKKSVKSMKKNNKKKGKIKKWQIVLIALISLIIVFLIYIFVASGNSDGPVYGKRCEKLVSIDKSQFSQVESNVVANDKVEQLKIEKHCRTIKMTFKYTEGTTANDAISIATDALHQLDDALGKEKSSGASWSQVFNKANGRMQYDVDFVLKGSGDDFPVFGTKHAGVDNISFTSAAVKDQETTDKVYQRQAEVDAANKAQQGN